MASGDTSYTAYGLDACRSVSQTFYVHHLQILTSDLPAWTLLPQATLLTVPLGRGAYDASCSSSFACVSEASVHVSFYFLLLF